MVTSILTSWGRTPLIASGGGGEVLGSTLPTAILDYESREIVDFITQLGGQSAALGGVLERAHSALVSRVRAVYSVDDSRPASRTLRSGAGSCSQRLAILEAVARYSGIPTRSRGLVVRGEFWFPRFRLLRPLLPDRVLLAWPEFYHDGDWRGASEIFGEIGCSSGGGQGFTNSGGETLFEAIGRSAVDWDGVTSVDGVRSCFDLSEHVLADLGRFSSRDELFAAYGQTLSRPARFFAEPILRRMSA